MSFFKDFKADLTQAVNELVSDEPEKNNEEPAEEKTMDDEIVNTLDGDIMTDFDFDTIGDLLDNSDIMGMNSQEDEADKEAADKETEDKEAEDLIIDDFNEKILEDEPVAEEFKPEENIGDNVMDNFTDIPDREGEIAEDDVTEIGKSTSITGNITSNGSVNIYGNVVGDVSCKGKLIVTGTLQGKSQAGEVYVNNSKIDGDISSTGSIKVGNGSVIIGNIYAESAVIGGAIKGDIDVHGPVIVDATAVIQGNIKSRSVHINNGAAIEGFCSQCYSDVDYKALFDDTFGENK